VPIYGSGRYAGPAGAVALTGAAADIIKRAMARTIYERMAKGVAARRAGHSLVVTSGFRSDAEQAELFARNPDPHWVAPPGHSLHRCATELDLGPASAYGWLATNAGRFGFVQRYSWEAWHYGFVAGPAPCPEAGKSVGFDRGYRSPGLFRAGASLPPGVVPPRAGGAGRGG